MLGFRFVVASAFAGCVSFCLSGEPDDTMRQTKASLHREATGESLVFLADTPPTIIRPRLTANVGVVTVSNVRAVQRKGTKLVDITYDLSSTLSYKCHVDLAVTRDGTTVTSSTRSGDVGDWVSPGTSRHITWNAGQDCPGARSFDYKVNVTAYEMAEQVSETWATITIAWAAYGGTDIDLCGYWLNTPSSCVGCSWGSGQQNSTVRALWRGDNTGSGPEYIIVSPSNTHTQYRIHANHFGRSGNPSRVDVSVTGNGVTKSITSKAGTRGGKAVTTDPYVTITFDEKGTPTAIERSTNL